MSIEQGESVLVEFSASVRKIVDDNDIEDIYNADQTAINYEYIPKKTLDGTGTKTVWIKGSGHEKDRLTAMVLADAKGTKYPLFLVLKTSKSTVAENVSENLKFRHGFGPILWPEIEEIQECHPSRIYGNPTGWWNGHISVEFLNYHFGHRRGTESKFVLLLWDDFSAHFTPEVITLPAELRVILEKIPPTYTWICQPADVAWMKPMKAAMRKRWVEYLRDQVNNKGDSPFRLERPDRFEIVEWINTAWEDLSMSTIVNGFRKCGLIDVTYASDENMDDNGGEEDDLFEAAGVLESLMQCGAAELIELESELCFDDDDQQQSNTA
ncbi:hypothetical protein AeMF1_005612 [Aphanomyces euteiches]|nr:hypothetical protein AeMF1_005612 [Aphanomyces euteiches]